MSLFSPEEREALIELQTVRQEALVTEPSRPNSRKGKAHVSDGERQAILALRAQRLSVREIADRIGRGVRTVEQCIKRAKEQAGLLTDTDWREEMALNSIDAINSALRSRKDVYKAGNLGKDVMKGLGEFAQDGTQVHINQLMASVPPEFRDRYFVTADVEDEK